jgi:hypothetical protein
MDTGTAVNILFTSNVDLFLVGLVRRVLTFPSGFLGEFDL